MIPFITFGYVFCKRLGWTVARNAVSSLVQLIRYKLMQVACRNIRRLNIYLFLLPVKRKSVEVYDTQ